MEWTEDGTQTKSNLKINNHRTYKYYRVSSYNVFGLLISTLKATETESILLEVFSLQALKSNLSVWRLYKLIFEIGMDSSYPYLTYSLLHKRISFRRWNGPCEHMKVAAHYICERKSHLPLLHISNNAFKECNSSLQGIPLWFCVIAKCVNNTKGVTFLLRLISFTG